MQDHSLHRPIPLKNKIIKTREREFTIIPMLIAQFRINSSWRRAGKEREENRIIECVGRKKGYDTLTIAQSNHLPPKSSLQEGLYPQGRK
ncbi:hypothetical protein NPIL_376361 [Nephila pilipes]|uniref:Uncharacterized protein n=1 Tax=Nephila pilipes TaxID=299642 RepID=A0A8X6UGG9_NEPPI|nr:hypothetical protein NPIL_376361 [Nephila pilipes]